MQAKIKLLRKSGKIPTRAHAGDAGLDFYFCPEDGNPLDIRPMSNGVLATGVSCEVPEGFMLEIKNKSSIAVKKQLIVGACVIDTGYTGEIFVNLNNVGTAIQTIVPGQKIAQGVFVKIEKPELILIPEDEPLYTHSDRKDGSLGSTGEF